MKSLLALGAILVVAGIPLRADSDIIGPFPAKNPIADRKAAAPHDALSSYKEYVYAVVGSYWYPDIDSHRGVLSAGKVKISFKIHSDGRLTDMVILEGKELKLLAKICTSAVSEAEPYKPFPPELVKQVGSSYADDYTFSYSGDIR